jgi:hypothetical protein
MELNFHEVIRAELMNVLNGTYEGAREELGKRRAEIDNRIVRRSEDGAKTRRELVGKREQIDTTNISGKEGYCFLRKWRVVLLR